MKKLIFGLTAIAFVVSLSAFTTPETKMQAEQHKTISKKLTQLIWYFDANKNLSANSVAEPADEVSRLQSAYPAYTFSLTSSSELHEYEFGFSSESDPSVDVIIYSNMP